MKAHASAGKFSNRWIGPFIICKKLSDLNYEIVKANSESTSTETENKFIVHVNRLKLVSENPNEVIFTDTKLFVVKRKGRPPKVIMPTVGITHNNRVGHPRVTRKTTVIIPKCSYPFDFQFFSFFFVFLVFDFLVLLAVFSLFPL